MWHIGRGVIGCLAWVTWVGCDRVSDDPAVGDLGDRLDALEASRAADLAAVSGRLDALEARAAAQEASIAALTARIDAGEAAVSGLAARADDHDASLSAIDGRLSGLDVAMAAVGARVAAAEVAWDDEAAARAAADAALSERIDASDAALLVVGASASDLDAKLVDLRTLFDELATTVDDVDAAVADLDGLATDGVARLAEVLTVDASDDLVLDGVNLMIRSGAGATDATPNGKGNLIVGYNESAATELRTGSHTIVVGPYHDYQAAWGIVSGYSGALEGNGAAILGGYRNRITSLYAASLGGDSNYVYGRAAAVVASKGQSVSVDCGARMGGYMAGSGC
jgi:hypothetical protein